MREFKNVTLRNVPREYNELANELAQSALKDEIRKEIEATSFLTFAVYQHDYSQLIICHTCGRKASTS